MVADTLLHDRIPARRQPLLGPIPYEWDAGRDRGQVVLLVNEQELEGAQLAGEPGLEAFGGRIVLHELGQADGEQLPQRRQQLRAPLEGDDVVVHQSAPRTL